MEVDHHHHHHHQPAKDRQTRGTAGWAGWLVQRSLFQRRREERESDQQAGAGRSRQEQAGAGRSRQDKKRNEEEEEEEEKCNHHELAVGYHCQGAIETRRSRLELARRRVKTRHLGRRCPHAAVGQKTRAGTAKTRERERERDSSIYRDGSQLLCAGALAAEP